METNDVNDPLKKNDLNEKQPEEEHKEQLKEEKENKQDQTKSDQIMQEIDTLEAHGAGDLSTQLRRVLRRLLISGACQQETCLEHVAKLFAIHRRTLNRRLRAQGTSFKALIDETRYDIARQLLRDTRLPVAEIAAALDYSECSAFDRAFRRWSGASPSAWRTAHTPD